MAKKKHKRQQPRRSLANRLAWGGPFFFAAVLLLVLALWPPWTTEKQRLKRVGLRTKAQVTEGTARYAAMQPATASVEYEFRPDPDGPVIRGHGEFNPAKGGVLYAGTKGDAKSEEVRSFPAELRDNLGATVVGKTFPLRGYYVEVAYLPDNPEVNCLVVELSTARFEGVIYSIILSVLALLLGGVGVLAALMSPKELMEGLKQA